MGSEEIIETDVLCIGGGIAGLMAAIRAGGLGARVVVAEKGNTLSSGAGGLGNDHFICYLPEVHGPDVKPMIESTQDTLNTVRGTATFVSERVTKPAISASSYITGISRSVGTLFAMRPRQGSGTPASPPSDEPIMPPE